MLLFAVSFAGCKKAPPPAEEPQTTVAPEPSATPAAATTPLAGTPPPFTPPPAPRVAVSKAPPPVEIWKEFSGDRAFEAVKKQVEVGPRPSGSLELEQVRQLIITALEAYGWEIERQEFTDTTPRGVVKFVNIIGRFSADGARPVPRQTQRAIVCSHYDTKRFSTIRFLGANDGASSTGALIELARVLSLDPGMAAHVELVFFDGEEAFVQFTDPDGTQPDGLYGSRHYAKVLRDGGHASQFRFGILWDMIGDSDLTVTLPTDSPTELARDILSSADTLGVRSHFGYFNQTVLDDHWPLNRIRIPTIDLIDFAYPAWHTADDKLDRLSAASLQTIGGVTLHHLRRALQKQ